jgi:hypothetical protein
LELCKEHNAGIGNIYLELETPHVTKRHRVRTATGVAEAAARIAPELGSRRTDGDGVRQSGGARQNGGGGARQNGTQSTTGNTNPAADPQKATRSGPRGTGRQEPWWRVRSRRKASERANAKTQSNSAGDAVGDEDVDMSGNGPDVDNRVGNEDVDMPDKDDNGAIDNGAGASGRGVGKPKTTPLDSAVFTCAHCKKVGHQVSDCHIPSSHYGSISACPVCNKADHHLDKCPQAAADPNDRDVIASVKYYVLDSRGHKPQIRSEGWTFYEVLDLSLCYGLLDDVSQVLRYPWGNVFAKKILAAPRGSRILGGKVHPLDFDPNVHTEDDLPHDPDTYGKTIAEILDMRGKGFFNGDRFVPRQHRKALKTPEGVADVVFRAMKQHGAFDDGGNMLTRSEVGAALKLVKPEEGGAPSAQVSRRVINVGGFEERRTVASDEAAKWSVQPRFNKENQFHVSADFEADVIAKVRRFFVDPDAEWDEKDPVYQRLIELYKAADEVLVGLNQGKAAAQADIAAIADGGPKPPAASSPVTQLQGPSFDFELDVHAGMEDAPAAGIE